MDRRRFESLMQRCAPERGNAAAGRLFDELSAHYAESHRRYHSPAHIEHCLRHFDLVDSGMDDPDAVEMALWYHDVIYLTTACDNELRSAKLFEERTRGLVTPEFSALVYDLIMATQHKSPPAGTDACFVVDIDLSSFGLPWDQFIRDSANVREEFAHQSDDVFYPRQKVFLRSLLDREPFCFTRFFRERHEKRARENITRYLDSLAERGLV